MKNLFLLTIAALVLTLTPRLPGAGGPSAAPTNVYHLDAADRKAIDAATFTIVKSTAQIPAPVRDELARLNHGKFVMAEPGKPFNATDAITDPTLPGRRLILAAVSKTYTIVHYESGGIAHWFLIAVFKTTNGKARLINYNDCRGPITNIPALKKASLAQSRYPIQENGPLN